MVFMVKDFDRFGPIAIFLSALTPLPDDLLFIPLGIMRYSLLRAFIPALIGKVSMNFIVAYSGRHAIQIIRDIFGEGSDWIAVLLGGVLEIGLLIIVIVVMFKVDWERIFMKYVKKGNENKMSYRRPARAYYDATSSSVSPCAFFFSPLFLSWSSASSSSLFPYPF